MTKHDLERAKRIEYEGRDADCLLFRTESWTRPGQNLYHEIVADFAKGTIVCSCEDGFYRQKWVDILTGEGDMCKHLKACHQLCKRIMEQK